MTPGAAAKALVTPELPTKSEAAKKNLVIFITLTSFLVFTTGICKPGARPDQVLEIACK
jgi:hypothetical protein